ncbi:7773_t:CDS:1, partial [Racocetra fulgida]
QYPLPKGWAIKGKQKFGKKGGAHISKEVADLLKSYFHAGNANSSQCYQPEDMLCALNKKADNNELDHTQIPKLETIRNWISRYSIAIKKEIAEKMLTSLNNNSEK